MKKTMKRTFTTMALSLVVIGFILAGCGSGTLSSPTVSTVPAIPIGITAAGGTQQVTISWPTTSGATSYNVYYSTTAGVTISNGTKITGATSPYTQTGLLGGTTYYYIVTAVNSVGESTASAQVTATTTTPAPAFDALTFYNTICLDCHGTLGVRTVAQITTAIGSVSLMGNRFSATGSTPLTAAQITAISTVSH